MHTPAGFIPAHALPAVAAGDALRVRVSRRPRARAAPARDDAPRASRRSRALARRRHRRRAAFPRRARRRAAASRIDLADDAPEPAGMRFAGLRSLFFKLPEPLLALAARAFQVVDWDRTHRFCGRCGTPTRDKRGRAREGVPGLRPRRVSARVAGDDGAGHARPRAPARARPPLSAGHVQRARGLRRAGRDDRGLHPPRGARGSRRRGRRHSPTSPASRGRSRTR